MKTALVVIAIFVCAALLCVRPKRLDAAARNTGGTGGSMEQQIVAKEREGLAALESGDLKVFADLTADDAVFVDSVGAAGKAQVISNVAGFKITEYAMDDVKFVPISEKAGLISYAITEKGVSHGKEFSAHVYVSSVWAQRGEKWVCLFSQETQARSAAPATH